MIPAMLKPSGSPALVFAAANVFRSVMIVARVASEKNGFCSGIVNVCPKVPDGAIRKSDELFENVPRA